MTPWASRIVGSSNGIPAVIGSRDPRTPSGLAAQPAPSGRQSRGSRRAGRHRCRPRSTGSASGRGRSTPAVALGSGPPVAGCRPQARRQSGDVPGGLLDEVERPVELPLTRANVRSFPPRPGPLSDLGARSHPHRSGRLPVGRPARRRASTIRRSVPRIRRSRQVPTELRRLHLPTVAGCSSNAGTAAMQPSTAPRARPRRPGTFAKSRVSIGQTPAAGLRRAGRRPLGGFRHRIPLPLGALPGDRQDHGHRQAAALRQHQPKARRRNSGRSPRRPRRASGPLPALPPRRRTPGRRVPCARGRACPWRATAREPSRRPRGGGLRGGRVRRPPPPPGRASPAGTAPPSSRAPRGPAGRPMPFRTVAASSAGSDPMSSAEAWPALQRRTCPRSNASSARSSSSDVGGFVAGVTAAGAAGGVRGVRLDFARPAATGVACGSPTAAFASGFEWVAIRFTIPSTAARGVRPGTDRTGPWPQLSFVSRPFLAPRTGPLTGAPRPPQDLPRRVGLA